MVAGVLVMFNGCACASELVWKDFVGKWRRVCGTWMTWFSCGKSDRNVLMWIGCAARLYRVSSVCRTKMEEMKRWGGWLQIVQSWGNICAVRAYVTCACYAIIRLNLRASNQIQLFLRLIYVWGENASADATSLRGSSRNGAVVDIWNYIIVSIPNA